MTAFSEQDCRERFKKLVEVEQRGKSNTHRIDKLEETTDILHEMSTNLAVVAEQTKTQGETITTIKNDIEDIKNKPRKRWDLLITVIISAAITALISYIVMALLTMGG